MKHKFEIKTIEEIRHPALLAGALESMGFLVDNSRNGTASSGAADNGFDVRIEDSHGHTVRGLNLEKWLASRKTPE
jgi:hypothetical protein